MPPTRFFKCMSDETRLLITLLVFLEKELCVCELVETLDESQSKISRHLAQLRNCGILSDRRKDQWVFYSLNPDLSSWVRSVLKEIKKPMADQLKYFQKNLTSIECRPARA